MSKHALSSSCWVSSIWFLAHSEFIYAYLIKYVNYKLCPHFFLNSTNQSEDKYLYSTQRLQQIFNKAIVSERKIIHLELGHDLQ